VAFGPRNVYFVVNVTLVVANDDVHMLPRAVVRQVFGQVVVAGVPLLHVCKCVESRHNVAPGVQVPVTLQWATPVSVLQASPKGQE
jgi:hypothetical protein